MKTLITLVLSRCLLFKFVRKSGNQAKLRKCSSLSIIQIINQLLAKREYMAFKGTKNGSRLVFFFGNISI